MKHGSARLLEHPLFPSSSRVWFAVSCGATAGWIIVSNVPDTRTLYENSRLSSSVTRVLPRPRATAVGELVRPEPPEVAAFLLRNGHTRWDWTCTQVLGSLIVPMIARGFESGCYSSKQSWTRIGFLVNRSIVMNVKVDILMLKDLETLTSFSFKI